MSRPPPPPKPPAPHVRMAIARTVQAKLPDRPSRTHAPHVQAAHRSIQAAPSKVAQPHLFGALVGGGVLGGISGVLGGLVGAAAVGAGLIAAPAVATAAAAVAVGGAVLGAVGGHLATRSSPAPTLSSGHSSSSASSSSSRRPAAPPPRSRAPSVVVSSDSESEEDDSEDDSIEGIAQRHSGRLAAYDAALARLNAAEAWYQNWEIFHLPNYYPNSNGTGSISGVLQNRGEYRNDEGYLPARAGGFYTEFWVGAGVGAPGTFRLITPGAAVNGITQWFTSNGTHDGHAYWRAWNNVQRQWLIWNTGTHAAAAFAADPHPATRPGAADRLDPAEVALLTGGVASSSNHFDPTYGLGSRPARAVPARSRL